MKGLTDAVEMQIPPVHEGEGDAFSRLESTLDEFSNISKEGGRGAIDGEIDSMADSRPTSCVTVLGDTIDQSTINVGDVSKRDGKGHDTEERDDEKEEEKERRRKKEHGERRK